MRSDMATRGALGQLVRTALVGIQSTCKVATSTCSWTAVHVAREALETAALYMKAQPWLAGGRRKLGRHGFSSDRPRSCLPPRISARPARRIPQRLCDECSSPRCPSTCSHLRRCVRHLGLPHRARTAASLQARTTRRSSNAQFETQQMMPTSLRHLSQRSCR